MMFSNIKILAIEDSPAIHTFLKASFEAEGAEFYSASTAHDGEELCENIKPDIVVLDLGLPDKDGLEILPHLKEINPQSKIVVLSVRKERLTIDQAYQRGADAYLTKPFLVEDLFEVITENDH